MSGSSRFVKDEAHFNINIPVIFYIELRFQINRFGQWRRCCVTILDVWNWNYLLFADCHQNRSWLSVRVTSEVVASAFQYVLCVLLSFGNSNYFGQCYRFIRCSLGENPELVTRFETYKVHSCVYFGHPLPKWVGHKNHSFIFSVNPK